MKARFFGFLLNLSVDFGIITSLLLSQESFRLKSKKSMRQMGDWYGECAHLSACIGVACFFNFYGNITAFFSSI